MLFFERFVNNTALCGKPADRMRVRRGVSDRFREIGVTFEGIMLHARQNVAFAGRYFEVDAPVERKRNPPGFILTKRLKQLEIREPAGRFNSEPTFARMHTHGALFPDSFCRSLFTGGKGGGGEKETGGRPSRRCIQRSI